MKGRGGFTLIEVLVTIAIMAILLTLSVVSLRSTQANARDEKRKTDIEVIARNLENLYASGSDSLAAGTYPGTTEVDTEAEIKQLLTNLDVTTLRAPNIGAESPMSFTVATSSAEPTPNASTYVYQPMQATGNQLCTSSTQECRKFTLYYKLETVSAVQELKSKHQ